MAESKPGLRKPVFTKVDQLRPGTSGHTLTVKVVSTKMVMQKGRPDGPQPRQMRIAECLVGDETGMIIFTARNDQGIIVITYCLGFVEMPCPYTSVPYSWYCFDFIIIFLTLFICVNVCTSNLFNCQFCQHLLPMF